MGSVPLSPAESGCRRPGGVSAFLCCLGWAAPAVGVWLLDPAPAQAKEVWLQCGSRYRVSLDRRNERFALESGAGKVIKGPALFASDRIVLEFRVPSESEAALSRGLEVLERVPTPFGLGGLLRELQLGRKYEMTIQRKTLAFVISSPEPAAPQGAATPVRSGGSEAPAPAAASAPAKVETIKPERAGARSAGPLKLEAGQCKKIPSPLTTNQL